MELLIIPRVDIAVLGRALAGVPTDRPSLLALVVPLHEAEALALRFLDGAGQPVAADLAAYARALSRGDWPVGCARMVGEERAWENWAGGERAARLTPEDDLFLPFDEEGFPDMGVQPRRVGDGVPDDWRRFRGCLDLGMAALHSCRFRPVLWAVERAMEGELDGTRALALTERGRAFDPPPEVGWPRQSR